MCVYVIYIYIGEGECMRHRVQMEVRGQFPKLFFSLWFLSIKVRSSDLVACAYSAELCLYPFSVYLISTF